MRKQRSFKSGQVYDRPIPIDSKLDTKTNFDRIRENVDILWKRVKQLVADSDKVKPSTVGRIARTVAAPAQTSSTIPVSLTEYLKNKNFFGFDKAGGKDVNTEWIDIELDTEILKDNTYLHDPNSSEVQVNDSDNYEVIAEAGIRCLFPDTNCQMRLMKYADGEWVEVEGTRASSKI